MLFRREVDLARSPPARDFDIVIFVVAVRAHRRRQIGYRGELIVEFPDGVDLRRLPAPEYFSLIAATSALSAAALASSPAFRLSQSPSRLHCAAPARPATRSIAGALHRQRRSCFDSGSSPRRFRPRSKISAFSRIHLMSYMACWRWGVTDELLQARHAALCRNPNAATTVFQTSRNVSAWMAGTSPAMTAGALSRAPFSRGHVAGSSGEMSLTIRRSPPLGLRPSSSRSCARRKSTPRRAARQARQARAARTRPAASKRPRR